MNTAKRLKAASLRSLLVFILFCQVAGTIAGFIYFYLALQKDAQEVSKTKAQTLAVERTSGNIAEIRAQLQKNTDIPLLVQSLYGSGELPQFTVVKNIESIAKTFNIPIGNITFADGSSDAATNQSGTTSTPTTQTPTAQSALPGSTVGITFEITSAVSYDQFLNFLNAIELNKPKLQVDAIDLPTGSTRGSVKPAAITVRMLLQ